MKSILARKLGMTQHVSLETSIVTPVTILEVPHCTVLQIKTKERDGYTAVVLGAFPRNKKKVKNIGSQYLSIQEFPIDEGNSLKKGDTVTIDLFKEVKKVKISGVSKGKGFAGVMKRFNFHGGPASHGSTFHREPGSSGTRAKPGRIQRGKKFPGHMGSEKITLRDIEVVDMDTKKNLLAVKGSIPGSRNTFISLLAQ